jgi:hypothetical protein
MNFCPSFQNFLTIWIKFASGGCLNGILKNCDFSENRQSESHTLRMGVLSPYPQLPVLGKNLLFSAGNLRLFIYQFRSTEKVLYFL